MNDWEIHAVKYADRNARTRRDSFILDDNHDAPHAMDYFVWVLKRGDKVILVDTGYDSGEATARGRPIAMDPREALRPLGISPEAVTDVIVTHLHYDHAGGCICSLTRSCICNRRKWPSPRAPVCATIICVRLSRRAIFARS